MAFTGRRQVRLQRYSYDSEGVYFITFCTAGRQRFLGCVVGRDDLGAPTVAIALTDIGRSVENTFLKYQDIILT